MEWSSEQPRDSEMGFPGGIRKGRPRGLLLGALFHRRALKEEIDSKGNRGISFRCQNWFKFHCHYSSTMALDQQIIPSEPVSLSRTMELIPRFSKKQVSRLNDNIWTPLTNALAYHWGALIVEAQSLNKVGSYSLLSTMSSWLCPLWHWLWSEIVLCKYLLVSCLQDLLLPPWCCKTHPLALCIVCEQDLPLRADPPQKMNIYSYIHTPHS